MKTLLLILVIMAAVLEIVLFESGRIGYARGYDAGLEDGIRMTNEVISEEGEIWNTRTL